MELLLWALALYAWQCGVYLPSGGLLLQWLPGASWLALRGPGLRLASPWPGTRGVACGGLPFELGAAAVYTREPVGWRAPAGRRERRAGLAGRGTFEARGETVRAHGRPFLRATSRSHAGRLAALLQTLADAEPGARDRLFQTVLDEAFDLDACRSRQRAARRATRLLRWSGDLQLVVVLGALPPAIWLLGDGAGWRLLLPAIAILHAVGLVGLAWAESRLRTPTAERVERMLVAALFPPALLRAAFDLVGAALVRHHPLTQASLLLPRARLEPLFRASLGALEHPAWTRHGGRDAAETEARRRHLDAERRGLLDLAAAVGLDPAALQASPPSRGGARYCPLCLDEFRAGFVRCASCGVATRPLAATPGSTEAAPDRR